MVVKYGKMLRKNPWFSGLPWFLPMFCRVLAAFSFPKMTHDDTQECYHDVFGSWAARAQDVPNIG
jgi:hypothetical protein